jgi:hypothetical protein
MMAGLLRFQVRNLNLIESRVAGVQALGSLWSKLVALGVGRVKGNEIGPRPMCWAWGYKALHQKPIVPRLLRVFDRTRAKQLRRFNLTDREIVFGPGITRNVNRRREPRGFVFSYSGQFTNLGGAKLVQNPWRAHNLKDRFRSLVFGLWKRLFARHH